jgi:hypothetical protein
MRTYHYTPYHRICKLAGLVLLLLTMACKKDFSPGELEDDQLVVLAEITAGDSVRIPIGKTLKVGNGNLIRFEKVNDASVTLTEDNKRSWILKPSYAPQYALSPTSMFTSRKRYISNMSYTLAIQHPTLGNVHAETRIPSLPKLLSVDTGRTNFEGRPVLAAALIWQDVVDKEEFYIIEAVKEIVKVNTYFYYQGVKYNYNTPQGASLYQQVQGNPNVKLIRDTMPQNKFIRLNVFTQDELTENEHIDELTNPFRRIFLSDKNFDGQVYSTMVFIDTQYFTSTDPSQKGRVRLQLKSASPELFNYLILYEKYKTDFGSVPANQLVSPNGNIQNGLGIFGGSARRERIWYFDQF